MKIKKQTRTGNTINTLTYHIKSKFLLYYYWNSGAITNICPAKPFKFKKQPERQKRVVEEGNTDLSKRRARLLRDIKAATPSPANQGSSKEFHYCTHAVTNDLSNSTVRPSNIEISCKEALI